MKFNSFAVLMTALCVLLFLVILLVLYRFVPSFNLVLNEVFTLSLGVGKILSNFFRWWFFGGIVVGLLILLVVYNSLNALIEDENKQRNISLAKKAAFFVGSFFAVGGLVTDSIDDSLDFDRSRYTTNQKLAIASLADKRDSLSAGIVGCDINAIYLDGIRDRVKSQNNEYISDKVLLCIYRKKYLEISGTLIDRLSYPENINGAIGIDSLLKSLDKKQTESIEILSMLSNQVSYSPVDLVKVKEDALLIVSDFERLRSEERVSEKIGKIKGIIFAGLGIDFSVLILALVMRIRSSRILKFDEIKKLVEKLLLRDKSD